MDLVPFLATAPDDFQWPRCGDADHLLRELLRDVLGHCPFADRLAADMLAQTSTRFFDWIDHLIIEAGDPRLENVAAAGFETRQVRTPEGLKVLWHPHAQLPDLLIVPQNNPTGCAIAVDSIESFAKAHDLTVDIVGPPDSSYRVAAIGEPTATLWVIERRGDRVYVPDSQPTPASEKCKLWVKRWVDLKASLMNRNDEGAEAMAQLFQTARQMIDSLGQSTAAFCFLEAERCYWESRNDAAQLQKQRQDKLGLGWANHDHHTFRSSRKLFGDLIRLLGQFGFCRRERFYAGADAAWGAQVMEDATGRLVIFADVDLRPEEIDIDFTTETLQPLDKPGTVGLWCALHGDSILEAGMHHLEAQFDFDKLRDDLAIEGVETMRPFSDFDHLRQAFTAGQNWTVRPDRLASLEAKGAIGSEAVERIKGKGAIGSHLENLQRRDGYKGFNQNAVSKIIQEVHPERQALQ